MYHHKETKVLFFSDYKKKRNSVLSLIKKSRDEYFKTFFDSHKNDIKKTWQGIKNIVNINKKQNILPVKLLFKKNFYLKDDDIAKAFNTIFTNIKNTIEEKFPHIQTHFSSYLKTQLRIQFFLNRYLKLRLLL